MPVTLPAPLVNDTIADADAVMDHINALASKFTEGSGGIGDDDFTGEVGRKLDGAKIAASSIPGAALVEEAVGDTKLAFDAADPGSDASRAVSGDHIKTLTSAHLDRILPNAVLGTDKLKMIVQAAGFSITGTPLTESTTFANLGALGIPVPTASAIILAMYFQNITVTNGGDLKSVWFERITTGANYQVRVYISSSGAAQVTGNIVVVSMNLT